MKQVYMVLARPDLGGPPKVRLVTKLEQGVNTWHSTTRVSPLFLPQMRSDDPLENQDFSGDHVILLLGPIHPKRVSLSEGIDLWQSLGCYNVILHSPTNDGSPLIALATSIGARYECWMVKEGYIIDIAYAPPLPEPAGWQKAVSKVLTGEHPEVLEEATREFAPLAASAIARATQVIPDLVPEFQSLVEEVSDSMRESAQSTRPDAAYEVLGQLTNINAALSRQTSQAFSGTSPVTETECHYWTHSLLGTGTANLALWKVARFVLKRLGDQRLPQRLAALRDITRLVEPRLERLADNDDFWTKSDPIGDVTLTAAAKGEPLTTVVTCFSGRDGYRSTLQTLSAPLAVIGSCNSVRWTLLTITHEISHIIVRGFLTELYPKLDKSDLIDASALIGSDPQNLLDAVRRYLLTTMTAMHQVETNSEEVDYSPDNLLRIANRWFREVEEIMVHVFDFLYFYGADAEKYIRGIWLSWSVIPNIAHRIPEYVVRSLCAILSLHLRRGPMMETVARDQVINVLKDLKKSGDTGEYVDQALKYIDDHWADIQQLLFARRNLVRLVNKFLYSERLASDFLLETNLTSGASARGGYGFRVGDFDDTPIDQPLRFVEEYTTAARPSAQDSMWMLTLLAFNTGGDTA